MPDSFARAEEERVASYFAFLHRRFEEKGGQETCRRYRLAGHLLDIHWKYAGEGRMSRALATAETEAKGPVDASFFVWEDDLGEYTADSNSNGKRYYVRRGPSGDIIINRDEACLYAYRPRDRRGYLCFQQREPIPLYNFSHPVKQLLHWWALSKGMVLLHGAAVGYGDRGVLIAASGGAGKSTLALSCLAAGARYVSDDYLLMESREGHRAFPIYSTGLLHRDSLEKLPALKSCVLSSDPARANKALLDLSPFRSQFVEGLEIRATLFPQVTDGAEPRIERARSSQGVLQLVTSTAMQSAELTNRDFFAKAVQSVKGLPLYTFCLSRDLKRNEAALKRFVQALS